MIQRKTRSDKATETKVEGLDDYAIVVELQPLLDKAGMSQRALARLTGIRQGSINEMANNNKPRLPLDILVKVCVVLGCEISDILKIVNKKDDKA